MLFEVVGRHQQMTLGKHLMCQDEESLLVIIHNIPSVLYSKTPTLISAANATLSTPFQRMKILHTADLHLGQIIYQNYDRTDEHQHFFRQLDAYYTESGKCEADLLYIETQKDSIPDIRNFITETWAKVKSNSDQIERKQNDIQTTLEALNAQRIEDAPDKEVLEGKIADNESRISDITGQPGGIRSQLETHQRNKAAIQQAKEALDATTAKHTKWDLLDKRFGGTRFRTLVQTYILQPLLNNANIYLEQITDRYKLTCSNENEQLAILVLDKYNKGQTRSATVLSGGERFMISLALSLALSSLNRSDMNIDILFIDEGFGTLDEKSLDSVMATLEKLQEIAGQSNRRVGIISHREELEERIPVKIKVTRKGEGRSLVEIKNA